MSVSWVYWKQIQFYLKLNVFLDTSEKKNAWEKIKYLAANSAAYYSCHCGNLSGINSCSYGLTCRSSSLESRVI